MGRFGKTSSVLRDLVTLGGIAFVIYMLYKCCVSAPRDPRDAPPPSYDDTFRSQRPQGSPPPYGFRQDYMPGGDQGRLFWCFIKFFHFNRNHKKILVLLSNFNKIYTVNSAYK